MTPLHLGRVPEGFRGFGDFFGSRDGFQQLCLMPLRLGKVGKSIQTFKNMKKHYFCAKHKNVVF